MKEGIMITAAIAAVLGIAIAGYQIGISQGSRVSSEAGHVQVIDGLTAEKNAAEARLDRQIALTKKLQDEIVRLQTTEKNLLREIQALRQQSNAAPCEALPCPDKASELSKLSSDLNKATAALQGLEQRLAACKQRLKDRDHLIEGLKRKLEDEICSNGAGLPEFRPGKYVDGHGKIFEVSGPGIRKDGRQDWVVQATDGTFEGNWITGSVKGHPTVEKLRFSSELPGGFSYGIIGSILQDRDGPTKMWSRGGLFGVRQLGDKLIVSRFHRGGPNPTPQEKDSFILTLEQ